MNADDPSRDNAAADNGGSAAGAPGAGASALDLRVILVGRTGLDAKLRLDPALELVKVKTPLEAIGELSDPIDEASPVHSVVIVAPEAEAGMEAGLPATADRRTDFLRALKRVDPDVRVLRMGRKGKHAPGTDEKPYDGAIAADATPEVVRAAVRGWMQAAAPRAAAPAAPEAPASANGAATHAPDLNGVGALIDTILDEHRAAESAAATPARSPAAAPPADAGDAELARLLSQGKDILDAAVGMIRARTGSADILFTPADSAPPPGMGAIVGRRGKTLGFLTGSAPRETLEHHAEWLSTWLILRDQQAQLRDAAFTDPLTGAYNRRFFDRFLSAAVDHAQRDRLSVTVMVFDIDDFKTYNDRYGHGAGDEILTETVRLLRTVTRPSDKVCRIGGDEFAVIFHEPTGPRNPPSKHPTSIFDIATRFQKAICGHQFPKLGAEAPGTLTISGGLATYPWDGLTPPDLLNKADDLAMQSKRQGKNALTLGPGAERVCRIEFGGDAPQP